MRSMEPRGARSGGHDSYQAARTAATCKLSRGGARCHGAALSTSKLRAWSPVCGSTLRICRPQEQPLSAGRLRFHTCCECYNKKYYQNLYFPGRVIFGYSYSSIIMEWRLRRVVPAAAVTTHAKPHAQQQLARDVEVERAAMGQRCRPESFDEVQRGNPQLRR